MMVGVITTRPNGVPIAAIQPEGNETSDEVLAAWFRSQGHRGTPEKRFAISWVFLTPYREIARFATDDDPNSASLRADDPA